MLLYAENSEDPKLDQLPVPASQSKAGIKAESAAEKVRVCFVSKRFILTPELIQTFNCYLPSEEPGTDFDASQDRLSKKKG